MPDFRLVVLFRQSNARPSIHLELWFPIVWGSLALASERTLHTYHGWILLFRVSNNKDYLVTWSVDLEYREESLPQQSWTDFLRKLSSIRNDRIDRCLPLTAHSFPVRSPMSANRSIIGNQPPSFRPSSEWESSPRASTFDWRHISRLRWSAATDCVLWGIRRLQMPEFHRNIEIEYGKRLKGERRSIKAWLNYEATKNMVKIYTGSTLFSYSEFATSGFIYAGFIFAE